MNHIVCTLEELEQMCNLPKRSPSCPQMNPAADACLGQRICYNNTLKTVTSICFEFQPGRVRATLR